MSRALDLSDEAHALVASVVDRFLDERPIEAARALEEVGSRAAAQVLAPRPAMLASESLRRLNPDEASRVLGELEPANAREILLALDPTRAAGLLARLSDDERRALLAELPERTRLELEELLVYPAGTAGHEMDARVTAFSPDISVAAALDRIRDLGSRRIADVMLIDEEGRLVGAVSLQDLVGADPSDKLGALARRDVPFVRPMTRREELVDLLNQHKLTSLPVVDLEDRLVGILRYSALVAAAQQDAAGDLQQMVGASREERALSSPWVAVRSRLPWLHVNLVTAFVASSVIGLFEDTIARFTSLAVLLPLVAGESGNTGGQAMAVTMRGLALREIRVSHWLRVVRKELAVGATNGLAIATVTALGVYVWSRNPALAGVIACAMLVSMCAASVAGASIPMLLVLLKRDPATAASIFLTALTDVVGFLTFLGLATTFAPLLANP